MRVLGSVLVVTSVLAGAVLAQESARGTPANASPAPMQSVPAPAPPAPDTDTPVSQPAVPTPVPPVPAAVVRPARPSAPAISRAPTVSGPSIVLVMESSGGLRAASELRAALTQVGYRVLSAAEAQHKSTPPDVLLTVAFTPPTATAARGVQVGYWGRDGQTDSLTAVSLATLDQLNAVALALSSALIDRHRNDDVSTVADSGRSRLFSDPRAPGVLYAMVSTAPRTNVRLRVEDF